MEIERNQCGPISKRGRFDNYSSMESSDYSSEESDIDSVYSCQDYETASARDSWEDWSPSSNSESEADVVSEAIIDFYEVEYEVASETSNNEFCQTESDDTLSDSNIILPVLEITLDTGDSGETGCESLEEVIIRRSPIPNLEGQQTDGWRCVRCKAVDTGPWRYCQKCYQIRKGWLPSRPRKLKSKSAKEGWKLDREGGSMSQESMLLDSGHFKAKEAQCELSNQGTEHPDELSQGNPGLCGRCQSRRADGLFVHGRIAHQMYCYDCSKLSLMKDKHCPMCRRTTQKVVKVFCSVI